MSTIGFGRKVVEFYKLLNKSGNEPVSRFKVFPLTFIPFLKQPEEKKESVDDIIKRADRLFEENKYVEVYNLLKQYKSDEDVHIRWRISRALYKMSRRQNDKFIGQNMLNEAYYIIFNCLELNPNVAEVYKWSAILYEAKLKNENRMPTLSETMIMKKQLLEADKLNPNDYAVLYMLGMWCYNMCSLTWIQRKIAQILFWDPPTSTYKEALSYFERAEELKPRYYVYNLYMLGKINYEMGNMYRAHYYLKIAAEMTPTTEHETHCVHLAKKLVKKLKHFHLKEESL